MTAARTPRRRARPPARAYHHGDLANALRDAAVRHVEEQGAEGFSLREAAGSCGVTVAAAYRHYPSRGELLLAVADVGFAQLAERMEKRVGRAGRGLEERERAEAELIEVGRSYILFAVEHPHLFRLMYGPSGPRRASWDTRPGAPALRVGGALVEAIRRTLCAYGRPQEDTGHHMVIAWSLVHGFAVLAIDGLWAPTRRRALDEIIGELGRAFIRSLR